MKEAPREHSQDPSNEQLRKEFARVNRALKTLGAGNHTVLHANDEQALLHDMCDVIVNRGGYRMACVGYAVHDDKKTVRWMEGLGANMERIKSFPFNWGDTETGRTVTGTAIRTGHSVVGRQFLKDTSNFSPDYLRLQQLAFADGARAISAFPLCVDGQVLGALVIVAEEPDAFDCDEVELLGELANDLAYGIANLRLSAQHREARATVERLAYYDELTGLPNRTLLLKSLQAAMESAKKQRASLALLHLEVGRFDEINRVLGYGCGDDLVQQLGRRLEHLVESDESLARVGEDEFTLLLPHAGAGYATEVAQKLLAALSEPVHVGALMVDARVDIGIALFPSHANDADALIRRAKAAMHQVKPIRGGYALYTSGQEKEGTRRLALMGDLHLAIGRNELRLYCQPKIDMASRRVCGAEALVRWLHPVHGMMPTTEFIALAEQAGMITPLTNWMMEAAFRQSLAWHEAGLSLALAINLSAHDLYDPGLTDRVRGLFSTSGLAPELIQFELTEGALMADPDAALKTLTRLKRMDVKLFVDDYGTGYSSLSYLQKLPIDAIKIDQSFVAPMVSSHDSAAIVSSTIELGHRLCKEVVAEGVETQLVWDQLNALGCDIAQGYLISRPMPAADMRQWAREWI